MWLVKLRLVTIRLARFNARLRLVRIRGRLGQVTLVSV